jgi:23S rRNA pseudouridine1911/1915/1917 synthase
VHLAHLRFPVVGDPVYGGRLRIPKAASSALAEHVRGFKRQALHAAKLTLEHPETSAELRWATSVPPDMAELMEALEADAKLER